jgi:hypothetical protein
LDEGVDKNIVDSAMMTGLREALEGYTKSSSFLPPFGLSEGIFMS